MQRHRRQTDDGVPALLPTFFAGTLVMIGAVVAMARIDNDWADLGAVIVLLGVTGMLLLAIARRVGNDDGDDDAPR